MPSGNMHDEEGRGFGFKHYTVRAVVCGNMAGNVRRDWVLVGFGLWKMCKNAELPHAWTCFLYPLYNICKLAERSMDTVKGSYRPLCKWSIWLLWATLAAAAMIICCVLTVILTGFDSYMWLLLALFPLCILLSAAWAVLNYYALFYLYKDYAPDQEMLMLLLSIVLGAAPIIFYVIMNVKPISVAGRVESGQPRYSKYN